MGSSIAVALQSRIQQGPAAMTAHEGIAAVALAADWSDLQTALNHIERRISA